MHGVPPELMAAGVLGPGLLPYARPQLVSTNNNNNDDDDTTIYKALWNNSWVM